MALNDLLSLLQQTAGSGLPVDGYAPDGSTDIVVPGRPPSDYNPRTDPEPPRYNDPASREAVTPEYVLNDSRMQPSPEELEELLPRKGMFGTKGTLRDILGTVGDAFLVQAGRDRIYAPRRQMEREGDAMFGVTQDPMQAIERLAIENPDMAQELFGRVQQSQYQQGSLASQEAARQSQAQDREFENREKGWNRIARWTAGGLPYEQIVAGAQNYGISAEELAELGVTPTMSGEEREAFSSMDMTTNQIRNIPFTERRVATGERNAETSRISATRPRASSQPRQPTEAAELARIRSKVDKGERLGAGEQQTWDRYLQGTRGSGRRTVQPSSSNLRIRSVRPAGN